jgi:hypothetical protein
MIRHATLMTLTLTTAIYAQPYPPTEVKSVRLNMIHIVGLTTSDEPVDYRPLKIAVAMSFGNDPFVIPSNNGKWLMNPKAQVLVVENHDLEAVMKAVYAGGAHSYYMGSIWHGHFSAIAGTWPVQLIVRQHAGDHGDLQTPHYDLVGFYGAGQ